MDISDDDLLKRAVFYARSRHSRGYQTRVTCVQDTFLLGSNYAAELCRRYGFDPYEKVRK